MEISYLQALSEGDEKAFERIYLDYYGKAMYFLTGLLQSKSDAEELAQDVFMKLWLNRESIDVNRSVQNYIYTMMRNAAFNLLKHRMVEIDYQKCHEPNVETDTSEEILVAKEISLLTEMTINRMPVRRQQIYRMSRNEGLSNEEIAVRLHISKKTVENQISLALGELKRVIMGFLLYFFV